MKKRIAVFANAWSEKCLSDSLEGVKACAKENDMDVFVFLGYAAFGMGEDEQREEKRIYQLPDLAEFDGVIMFSSTMNFHELIEDIRVRAINAKVPLVSIGIKLEGVPYVGFSNKETMCELVQHLVDKHNVRDVEFIGGPKGNESSDERLEAIREVFEKNHLTFDESHAHHGDWGVNTAVDQVSEILSVRKEHLPDAFICANDSLALGICDVIEKAGFTIPKDVIVTGYDKLYDGQIFYPSMCTVGQDDFGVGKAACESLMNMITTGSTEDVIIQNQFIPNQSCGCEGLDVDALRRQECKNHFYEKVHSLEFSWSNGWFTQRVLESTHKDQLRKNMEKHFEVSKMFDDCGTVYVLEDTSADNYLDDKEVMEHDQGYSDELIVLTAVDRRKIIPIERISRRELIPGYKKEENNSRLYLFLPAHFTEWVFGYVVIEDWIDGVGTRQLKTFSDNFNYTVNKLKQNLYLEHVNAKLQELYTKDSLTGMYNRFGYDTEAVKVYEACLEQQEQMMLMFIDINRMKLINDYYGHLQGDIAIKTVADAILNNLSEKWIAIRFGGDEFLVVGSCDTKENIEDAQNRITEQVKRIGKEMNFQFYLSVSCGYMHFVPEKERTLDSYVKETDEAMYEIKARIHMSDPELRAFVEKCSTNPI